MEKNFTIKRFFIIFLIFVGILIFLTNLSIEIKTLITSYSIVIVTGLGFINAVYQLRFSFNKYYNEINKRNRDYLDLSINNQKDKEFYSIKTKVINASGEPKEIYFSFILILKQDESIIEKISSMTNSLGLDIKIECTNDFYKFKGLIDRPIFFENSLAFIPLYFYYDENVRIGNENPSFTYTFDNNKEQLIKGIYTSRFFIFPKNGYHRSTADSLII
jgi:hypothetical protein